MYYSESEFLTIRWPKYSLLFCLVIWSALPYLAMMYYNILRHATLHCPHHRLTIIFFAFLCYNALLRHALLWWTMLCCPDHWLTTCIVSGCCRVFLQLPSHLPCLWQHFISLQRKLGRICHPYGIGTVARSASASVIFFVTCTLSIVYWMSLQWPV